MISTANQDYAIDASYFNNVQFYIPRCFDFETIEQFPPNESSIMSLRRAGRVVGTFERRLIGVPRDGDRVGRQRAAYIAGWKSIGVRSDMPVIRVATIVRYVCLLR